MNMIARRLAIVGMMAAAWVLAVDSPAQARTPYDGYWSVVVVGGSGQCAGGSYRYAVTIRNGIVSYGGGDAYISGRVNAKGGVYVRVSAGGQSAAGSGRLYGNRGGGSWRGQSSFGACAGSWSASRMGG
jgi:hypothetical protein